DKMMAHLFALTDLEYRFNMNFNVIDSKGAPRVMPIGDVLREFVAHQKVVLCRRTNWRLANIARRLEILGGLLVVYLNLDRVIEIIRNEDDAKSVLMSEFNLSEIQVEAILNTRLRSLRKLEEMEIKREDAALREEQAQLQALLASEDAQNNQLKAWFNDIKKTYDKKTKLGRRRTTWAEQTEEVIVNADEFIEKEPLTIILSTMGWIRAAKGHLDLNTLDLKFKEGDELQTAFHAQSTDKINLFTSGGKMFTLSANELPSARGFGESVRMMVDVGADEDIVQAFVLDTNARYLLVSRHGNGFIITGDACIAQTKNGKQVMNTEPKNPAHMCVPVIGDTIAMSGSNDKLLIFATDEIPQMSRGKGVILQKYNAERTFVLDVMFFNASDGFGWTTGRGTTRVEDWSPWRAKRASQGRTVPVGFPRSGKFGR
ncbi:MAG: DNA gyrase subunit A, partial [Alphaproteobacteria bacterium]